MTFNKNGKRTGTIAVVLALVAALPSCGTDAKESVELTSLARPKDIPSWKAFKEASVRTGADGSTYYVVEWDLPLRTEAELRAYYEDWTSTEAEKGVVHTFNGGDDVWRGDAQLHLRYCVDTGAATGFDVAPVGVNSATLIAAAQKAAAAWHAVANITFTYDPANNGNCSRTSPIPDAMYVKIARDDALASPCSFGPQSHTNWTCGGLDGNTIGVNSNYAYPGVAVTDWGGVLMHEFGHTLGLHHEQFHTVGGGCADPNTRNVTPTADVVSIMGYPKIAASCSNMTPSLSALSAGDGWSVRTFYGMPAAWYVGVAI